jgi:hypothetical protein
MTAKHRKATTQKFLDIAKATTQHAIVTLIIILIDKMLNETKLKFLALVKRNNVVNCTDDELIHNDWINEWQYNLD